MMAGVGYVRRPGDEVDVHDAEAMRLIDAGYAEIPIPKQDGPVSFADWPLGINPAEYLRRFPLGPNVKTALRLVEVR